MQRAGIWGIGLLWASVLLTLSACVQAPAGSPVHSPAVAGTTPARAHSIRRLDITLPGGLEPAPDGTLLAGTDVPQSTLILYDSSGHLIGTLAAPTGYFADLRWLPDSSAVLALSADRATSRPGPLTIVDRRAHAQVTALVGEDAAVSPDGRWIAITSGDVSADQSAVQVMSRADGAVHTLVRGPGVRFLGWQGNAVIYATQGSIYLMQVAGGSPQLLTATPGGEALRAPLHGPVSSPDGQVLVVSTDREQYRLLVGGRLLPMPPDVGAALPWWSGPHEALGLSAGHEIVLVDMRTGAVEADTGVSIASGSLDAVSGAWVAWRDGTTLYLTNYQTKQTIPLGAEPTAGTLAPFGAGRFVLHGQAQTYILDPTLGSG